MLSTHVTGNYSAWGVFFVVVYGTRSHLQIIGTGCAPVVLGVTFMLITVRVGLGLDPDSRYTGTTLHWAAPPRSEASHMSGDYPMPLQSISFLSNLQMAGDGAGSVTGAGGSTAFSTTQKACLGNITSHAA